MRFALSDYVREGESKSAGSGTIRLSTTETRAVNNQSDSRMTECH